MKFLIIGGTGLTGPHIVSRLADLGHDIVLFHRGETQIPLPASVKEILGDRNHLPDHAGELQAAAPDVVLDMWALTEEHAIALMDTFRRAAGRVVVISSIDVYRAYGRLHRSEPGPADPVPLTEDSPLRQTIAPDGPGYNKTGVERVVMGDPDLPATVLRYPAVYGAGDRMHRLFFTALKRMFDRRPIILLEEGMARWRFSHGYAENLAQAVVLAVTNERATGRIYNVAEKETPPREEWIRQIGQAAGWEGEILALPKEQLPAHLQEKGDMAQDWVVDTHRIRQELAYEEIVAVEAGLQRTVAWERTHMPDKIDPKAFDYAAEDAVVARLRE